MQKKKITKRAKRRLMMFGIPSLVLILYFCITFASYIYNFTSLRNEEKQLKHELSSLQEEKIKLKTEIQKLNDPDYIIRFAKEKYLYSTEGEYVIKLTEKQKAEIEEKQESYVAYFILGTSAVVLSILFLKKRI